jgi:hypothetical protein
MNRSWISKLSRGFCPAIVGTLVLTACASVQAAPLGNVVMEGRKQGETAWATALTVAPGDVIEYRLRADMAALGTSNTQGATTRTITSLTPSSQPQAGDGFNSLHVNITQQSSAPIQVSFNAPLSDPNGLASFRNGWADGTGASAGTLAPRAGGTNNDIMGIRPVHASGVFSGIDPEDIVSGSTFQVVTAAGGSTVLTPTWGTTSGGLKINGAAAIFVTSSVQNSADPLVGFSGLTLNAIPEPSTIALIGMGLIGLVAVARRRRTA